MTNKKITNITPEKCPNDYVKEETENRWRESNPEIEYTNPITGEVETLRRNLIIVRMAQWSHYFSNEMTRLIALEKKCSDICDALKADEEAHEKKLKEEKEEKHGKS